MTERPEVELNRNEFRQAFRGTFGNPRDLWFALAFWGVLAIAGAYLAVHFGTFWAALIPIPFSIGVGIALAALFPNRFFGAPR